MISLRKRLKNFRNSECKKKRNEINQKKKTSNCEQALCYFPINDTDYYQNTVILKQNTHPKFATSARIQIIKDMFNDSYESWSSRILLNDYMDKVILFEALLSDIVIDERNIENTRLLLERINIDNNNLIKRGKIKLSSHLWIKLKDINHSIANIEDFTLSIGDRIIGTALVSKYRGHVEQGLYATKFGLGNIVLVAAGITWENEPLPRNDYPRYGDWVVKILKLPSLSLLETALSQEKELLENYTKILKYMRRRNTRFILKKSQYQTYKERLKEKQL